MSRAAPGAQLSEGRIRVDAGKALAKLREYQLTDRTMWILEGIRGAVAAGATAISLDGDANDIWLAWDGPSLTDVELTGLFDELVSPEATTERQHIRLIAAAVNSALGMDPAYVDVYAIRPAGSVRARYRSEIFDGAEALRRLTAEAVERPEGRADGMLVHLRRRFGFEVMGNFVTAPLFGSKPSNLPELALAHNACREISVPLRIGAATLQRSNLGTDILRVKLADLDGFLAIGLPGPDLVLTVAERGVAVVDVQLDLGFGGSHRPTSLRAYVDAPRMPTNASRSDVRRAGHPITTAEERARDALPVLVAALVEKVKSDPDPHNPARAAVFRLLASVCAVDGGLDLAIVPDVLDPLLDLPLVLTATGKLVSLGSTRWDPVVHTGPTPYPDELAPWLDDHRWIPPGDSAALLYDPGAIQRGLLARGPMRRRARWARRGLKRKQRFFNHAQRPATLQGSGYYIRAQLGARVLRSSVDPTTFRDLSGEVALMRPDASATNQLVVLHTGRVLERVELAIRIPCAAIIESPRIVPHPAYTSAERGRAFDELERVVRAGITCLGEGLALALAGDPDGRFPIVGERDPEQERQMIRAIVVGLYHAREAIPPVIRDALVWRTVQGTFVSLTALRGEAVIGVGRPETSDDMPAGRIVLAQPVDRAMLRHLAPRAQVIDYATRPNRATVDAFQLAYRVAKTTGIALAIQQRDRASGAVGPAVSKESRVGISHTGVTLDEISYEHELTPVEILVDDAAIVPTADWHLIHDDAGITSRSFEGWELALLRAIASTLAGDRPRELVGNQFTLDDKPGRVLCEAIAIKGTSLLGPELRSALAATPLFDILGDPVLISATELARRHPAVLDYVTPEAIVVHTVPPGAKLDPAPLVASPMVAGLAAGLADRTPRDVSSTLSDLARQQRRTERLAAHRLQPTQELALRGLTVPLHGAFTGAVGVGAGVGAMTVVVRVEGRDFGYETRRGAPVEAIVEVDEKHVDGEFQAVLPATMSDIVLSVHLAVSRLVRALVAEQAETLATPSPGRTFLAAWLEFAKPQGPHRVELVAARLWPAVQGGPRVALAAAVRSGDERTLEDSAPSGQRGTIDELWVATWTGEWLGPAENEVKDPLDVPVLLVDDGELRSIYRNLYPARHVDVSGHITKLQSRRRVLRGLTRQPTIPNALPELTRDLASLGPEGKALAPGQITLLDTPHACVYLHAGGELRARVALTVLPPVALAIEAPDLVPPGASPHAAGLVANEAVTAALETPAAELADRLVESILAATPVDALAPAVRKQLARAVMTGMQRLQGAPLFETLAADPLASAPWVQWDKLVKQHARFGNVWYVSEPPPDRVPLDPKRRVFVLAAYDAQMAVANGLAMVQATHDLHLDAVSRRNQARPTVPSLELGVPVLASITLDGDGVTRPRGVVGVLDPSRGSERALHEHRRGHPFDPAADPCVWPTVAAIDFAPLAPDRTWASAVHDANREQVLTAVRDASRTALASYAPAVPDGMHAEWVNDADSFGAVWLAGAPLARLGIHLMSPTGKHSFVPLDGLGMAGALVTLSTDQMNMTLNAVCARAYVQLVRKLALAVPTDDAGLAHVAYAIGTKRLDNAPAAIRFPCFAPKPLDPAGLFAVLGGDGPISVIDDFDQDPRPALVLDGSVLATTLLSVIDHRRRKGRPAVRKPRAATAPPPAPAPPHQLQPLVDALHRRLGIIGIRVPAWTIAEDDGPLLRWDRRRLVLAAHHARAIAIASHVISKSPDASDLVDLLAAHAATVMNVALTEITDANERAAVTILASDA